MKTITLYIFILLSFYSIGQSDSTKNKTWNIQKSMKYIDSRHITFTRKQNSMFSHINNIGYRYSFPGVITKKLHCYNSFSFNQSLPKEEVINDTLNTKITGYNFDMLIGLDIFNKSRNIDLALLFGFEVGRLRLYGNPLLRKKNGHFAPKIEIQPKIKLKRLVIGGTIGYGYDISNPNWKDTWFSKDKSYTLNKLKQSGFSWQVFLGWSI